MSRVREGDVMMEAEIRMIVGFEDGGRDLKPERAKLEIRNGIKIMYIALQNKIK